MACHSFGHRTYGSVPSVVLSKDIYTLIAREIHDPQSWYNFATSCRFFARITGNMSDFKKNEFATSSVYDVGYYKKEILWYPNGTKYIVTKYSQGALYSVVEYNNNLTTVKLYWNDEIIKQKLVANGHRKPRGLQYWTGTMTNYWRDGTIREEGKYKQGDRVGWWTVYDEKGEIRSRERYISGVIRDTDRVPFRDETPLLSDDYDPEFEQELEIMERREELGL